jgi:predicted ATPase
MLKKLILENWKSFRYAELEIEALTVLIGTNASGKSNALDALEFLSRLAQDKPLKQALVGDSQTSAIRGGTEWAALKPHDQFTLRVWIGTEDEDIDYVYSISVATKPDVINLGESLKRICYIDEESTTTDLLKTELNGSTNLIFRLPHEPNFTLERNSSALGKLQGVRFDNAELDRGIQAISETLKNILVLNPVPAKMRDYSPISESLVGDASNIAGVLAGLSIEQKATVEATLSNYGTQLPERDIAKIWAEPVGRLGQDAMLYCDEIWVPGHASTTIDARGMSDGTLRFLAIVTALLTRPEGSQVVIEEVENGLHPSRAQLLLNMLLKLGEERQIDVLVTTHDPALLDTLLPDLLPAVIVAYRNPDTGESQLIPLEDLENLPQIVAIGSLGQAATRGSIERSLSHRRVGVG